MNETDDKRELLDRAVTLASLGFTAITVVRTLRAAANDSDGLQLSEALLRGATLAVSIAIFVRTVRAAGEDNELEAASA